MTLVPFVTQAVLAAVFATAGLAKLADREGTRRALADFGVPRRLLPFGLVLPLLELATAGTLLANAPPRAGALAACGLLLVFSAAILLAVRRGRAPECRCFGRVRSAPVSRSAVARNLCLAALAAWLAASGPGSGTDPASAAALGAAIVVGSIALILRGRRVPGLPDALPVGAAAPEFSLPALGGGTVTLARLRSQGRPVLLVFADVHCGPCAALAPDIARWQRELAGTLTIAVLERGLDRHGDDGHGRANVLVHEDGVEAAYGVAGTPSAVLVDAEGRIASGVVAGAEPIRGLVGATTGIRPSTRDTGAVAGQPPLGRRDFVLGVARAAAATALTLVWPARALSAATLGAGSRCGPNRECPEGMACVGLGASARCVPGDGSDCSGLERPGPDWACCGGSWRHLSFGGSNENCGGCGIVCPKKDGCWQGVCRDTSRDPKHCGSVNHRCPPETPICHAGKCRKECPKPLRRCGKTCGRPQTQKCCNGRLVEKDLICGDGCKVCKSGETCENGKCVGSCPEGQTRCGGRCVDLGADNANCRECGRECAEGLTCCGEADCVDTRIRHDHCTACFKVCPPQYCTCWNSRCTGPPEHGCWDGL